MPATTPERRKRWQHDLIDHDSPANFVPVNAADHWLHLVLAVGMIALGVVLGRSRSTG